MSGPEAGELSPAAREAVRKRALLVGQTGSAPAPDERPDPEAARKRALLAPTVVSPTEEAAARKRILLQIPPPPDAPPAPSTPSRTWRARERVVTRLRASTRRQLAGATAIVVLVAGTLTYGLTRPPAPVPLTQKDVAEAVTKGIEAERKTQAAKPPDGETVYQTIRPSVVLITVDTTGDGVPDGSGAGTVVRDDGTILTALHVVAGATRITVQFIDGSVSQAELANVDGPHDIAVLSLDQPPALVIPAVLGGGVRVGDPVWALGHPLGLNGSLSAGIVSATGRSLVQKAGPTLKDMIQIDAAVNPGNSGGPLLNSRGEVVGVISALANPSDSSYFIGIGFAAPITSAGGAAGAPPQ